MTQKQQESSDSLTGEEDEGEGAGRDGGWSGRAGWGGAGMQSRPGCERERVHTDPEWVEVVLIMRSQLPMWVTGSEQGPAGQSSFLGIA